MRWLNQKKSKTLASRFRTFRLLINVYFLEIKSFHLRCFPFYWMRIQFAEWTALGMFHPYTSCRYGLRNTTEQSKSLLFREKQLNSCLIEWILSFLTGERKLVFTFKYYYLPLINIRWSLVWLPLHQTTPHSNLGLQWRNLDICSGWIDGLLMRS